jgi:hypothetical protein
VVFAVAQEDGGAVEHNGAKAASSSGRRGSIQMQSGAGTSPADRSRPVAETWYQRAATALEGGKRLLQHPQQHFEVTAVAAGNRDCSPQCTQAADLRQGAPPATPKGRRPGTATSGRGRLGWATVRLRV